MKSTKLNVVLLGLVSPVLVWSILSPHDYFTWFLEALPVLIVLPVLILTYSRFQFTAWVYVFLAIHAVILLIGAHYTYAEVPLFNWLKEILDLKRNYYDRVGHFFQGFVPAMVMREILIRKSPVKQGGWLNLFVVSFCLAISACYELFEWAVACFTGSAAESFLGTQGDIWDTQWDMMMALVGSLSALFFCKFVLNLNQKRS